MGSFFYIYEIIDERRSQAAVCQCAKDLRLEVHTEQNIGKIK
jgi:hypothetical protein